MKISVFYGDGKVTEFVTLETSIILGSSTEADIRITDEKVSRKHLKLEVVNKKYYLTDLGSKNGVFVNEEKIPAGAKILFELAHSLRIGSVNIGIESENLRIQLETPTGSLRSAKIQKKNIVKKSVNQESVSTDTVFSMKSILPVIIFIALVYMFIQDKLKPRHEVVPDTKAGIQKPEIKKVEETKVE